MEPYSNENLIWNEQRGRYILTEKALLDNGTNLRARLSGNRTVDPTSVINRLMRTVSDMIYNYIHTFNGDTLRQDRIIATVPSARKMIYEAMLSQCEYVLMNGDLSRSTDESKRKLSIDQNAQLCLSQRLPEIGQSVLYTGGW